MAGLVRHERKGLEPQSVVQDVQSPFAKFNIASQLFSQLEYYNCLAIADHLAEAVLNSGEINIAALLTRVHLLRLETVIKVYQNGKYADVTDSAPTLNKPDILRYAKASEDAIRAILRSPFFADHWPSLPQNADILSLAAPSPISDQAAAAYAATAQSWVYTTAAPSGDTNSAPAVTTHGYLLYVGVVIALHMQVCLARLNIALSGMNDAKIHLRSALDLHTRYLKPVEQQWVEGRRCDVTEISALVQLIGSVSVPVEDSRSLRSQIGRQQRIVMDVMVRTSRVYCLL
jgi:hypothetical protein